MSFKIKFFIACAFIIGLSFTFSASAQGQKQQDEQDESRQIYFDYRQTRASKQPKKKANSKAAAIRYVRKTPKLQFQAGKNESAQVGITLWRLRPAAKTDDNETRILEQDEGTQWTPVRVEGDTPLSEGDRVRLSIESPRAGYLYVIDREQYADGSFGDPYLIFPNQLTRGGENRVSAGVLVDIPANGAEPGFFRMKPSRAGQVAEVLTVLVTAKPLDGVPPLGRKMTKLTTAQVAEWEKRWAVPFERFEMEGGAGRVWTKAEKAAGTNEARLLDQDDPTPQTSYRVVTRAGQPLLVTVPLRYGNSMGRKD